MSKKELMKKETTSLELPPAMWGHEEPVRVEDIVFPTIVLAQALTPSVVEGKAKAGDIISFPNGTILGNAIKPVLLQPIMELPVTWKVYIQPNKRGKEKFVMSIPFVGNESLPIREDVEEGELRRYKTYSYFVLIPGETLPHKISFKKTSGFVGKQIYTHLSLCRNMRVSPASFLLGLRSKQQVKDDNPYFVYDLLADKKEVEVKDTIDAYKWYQSLNKTSYKVAEEPDEVTSSESDVTY